MRELSRELQEDCRAMYLRNRAEIARKAAEEKLRESLAQLAAELLRERAE